MKILKRKILILLLIIAMMPLQSFVVNALPMDKAVMENEDFLFLEALGFIKRDELPFLTLSVTRKNFVKLVVRISGTDAEEYLKTDDDFPFDDVASEDRKYVYAAYSMGLISASPERKFNPDDAVTTAQASKILSIILGYGEYAKAKGGFPDGYIRAATEAEVFDGCNIKNSDSISFVQLFKMLRNTLTADLYEMELVSQEKVTYSKSGENTLLSKYFDVYCAEAIVTANEFTSVNCDEGVMKGCVEFGGEIFADECGAGNKIGCRIKAYYKNDGSTLNKILYFENSRQNKAYTVESYDIADTSNETLFSYYEDNKLESLEIRKTATLIYNGKFERLTKEKLLIEKGTVTLIDNNGDNKIEVVNVEEYNLTMLVNAVSQDGIVSDLLSANSLYLNEENEEYSFEILKNGIEITPAQINSGDVITVALPTTTDGCYKIKILVQSESYEGEITAINASENKIWVNEREFRADDTVLSQLKPGDEGMFFFDSFEQIITMKEYEKVIFGYLYKIEQKGLNPVQAKIFTENNRWVVVDFEKNIVFNQDKNYQSKKLLSEELLFQSDTFRPQMIAYYVTEDRKISKLFTASDDTDCVIGEESVHQRNNDFRLSYRADKANYREYSGSFEAENYLSEKVKIFMIPEETKDFEDEILVCDGATLAPDREYRNLEVYNRSVNGLTSLIMIKKDTDSYVGTGFMVVNEVRYGTDHETGAAAYVIKGYQNGVETQLFTTDTSVQTDTDGFDVKDLSFGDVIQFEIASDGNIGKIYLKYDYSDSSGGIKGTYSYSNERVYNSNNFISGTVKSCDIQEGMLTVNYQETYAAAISLTKSQFKVYRYDTEEKTLTLSDAGEIVPGRKIFMSLKYLRPQTIVVYN